MPDPLVLVGSRFVSVTDALAIARRGLAAGRIAQAADILDRTLAAAPEEPSALAMRGVLRYRRGDVEGAASDLARASVLRPQDAGLLGNLGQVLVAAGRAAEGCAHLDRAAALAPANAVIHNALGTGQRAVGDLAAAAASFRRATGLDPQLADAWHNLGALEAERDRTAEALRCFEAAARARPDADGFARIAATRERSGDLDGAATAAQRALELEASHAGAAVTLGRVCRRRGDLAAAEQQFRKVAERPGGASGRSNARAAAAAAQELGLLLERRGDHEQAWHQFQRAHDIQRAANPALDDLAARFRDQVARLTAAFDNDEFVAALPAPPNTKPSKRRTPAFLVGFPRSGTTLLVRALAAHPGTCVLDEKPVLSAVLAKLKADGVAYPEGLAGLSPGTVEGLRDAYWQAAAAFGGEKGKLLVDKDPVNAVHVGLIHLLFPGAPIVYSIRDPRDACLSCFANIFRLTPALATFGSLEGAADSFAAVAALFDRCRDRLRARTFMLRYEDLVSDFPRLMRDLLDFLELPWDEAVTRYHAVKDAPLVRTPSYDQVDQPPYRDAIGRWRRYEARFEEAGRILAPWVEKLGYD